MRSNGDGAGRWCNGGRMRSGAAMVAHGGELARHGGQYGAVAMTGHSGASWAELGAMVPALARIE